MRKQFIFQSGDIQMAKVNIKANSPILNLHSNLVIFKCLQKNMLLMRKFYLHSTLVSSIGYIFFQISNQLFYSILTLKLDFSRACLSGLHILLGQLLPI